MKYVTLTPAYGRDYKSARAVRADYFAGKDFVYNDIMILRYCSVRDFEDNPAITVNLRYNKQRSIVPAGKRPVNANAAEVTP